MTLIVVLGVLAALPPAAEADACAGQDATLAQRGADAFSTALACGVRAARGDATAVRVDADLSTAASRHALDMVARRYFDHVSPTGGLLTDRLQRAGWRPRHADWEAAEDIEWATGAWATPTHVIADFLASPPHRRILLDGDYDELGIGIAPGTPAAGPDGVTVVLDFGRRGDR